MNIEEKKLLLDELCSTYQATSHARMLCVEKGLKAEAKELKKNQRLLDVEIDELLVEMYSNWIGEANKIIIKMKKTNNDINTCINEIKSNIDVANNIVKFIGYLDQVINTAADWVI